MKNTPTVKARLHPAIAPLFIPVDEMRGFTVRRLADEDFQAAWPLCVLIMSVLLEADEEDETTARIA